jgi:hypothetical protein
MLEQEFRESIDGIPFVRDGWKEGLGWVRDGLPFQRIRVPSGLRRGRREEQLHSRLGWVVRYPINAVLWLGRDNMLFTHQHLHGQLGVVPLDAVAPLRSCEP